MCQGAGPARVIDFFIIDRALAPMVEGLEALAELIVRDRRGQERTVQASPHRVVRLRMKQGVATRTQPVLKLPRIFPRDKPVGCARRPHAPGPQFIDGLRNAGTREERIEGATKAWADFSKAMEIELCGICDHVSDRGADPKWGGREVKPTMVERQVMPRRAAGAGGHMKQEEYAEVWATNRLRELRALALSAEEKGELTEGQRTQWRAVVRKFCSPSAPIARHSEGRWHTMVQELQAFALTPARAKGLLNASFNWSTALVRRRTVAREKESRKAWRRWIGQQAKAGGPGGLVFRFIKRVEQEPDLVIRCTGGRAATPRDILDSDFKGWDALWRKLAAHGSDPWRTEGEGREGKEERELPELSAEVLRKAARTFKHRTAIGVDAVAPGQMAWLSDELLQALAEWMMAVEVAGVWNEQASTSIIHLIPKDSGGRRPIGILASTVRLWERARKPVIQEWRRRVDRKYNWMAAGRGAERSVWAQAVYEEAARGRGHSTASVLIDLVKAFEQVVLAQVWEKGKKHAMPRKVLRLALEARAPLRGANLSRLCKPGVPHPHGDIGRRKQCD